MFMTDWAVCLQLNSVGVVMTPLDAIEMECSSVSVIQGCTWLYIVSADIFLQIPCHCKAGACHTCLPGWARQVLA